MENVWDDAYLTAVGAQLGWWREGEQPKLAQEESGARLRNLEDLLGKLEAAGATVRHFLDDVRLPESVGAPAELRVVVGKIRDAGSRVFDALERPGLWLACTADWPAPRSGLPDDAPRRRVELWVMEVEVQEHVRVHGDRGRVPDGLKLLLRDR